MLLSLTVSANSYDEFKAKIAKAHDEICNTISQQTSLMDFSRHTSPAPITGPTCSDTASESVKVDNSLVFVNKEGLQFAPPPSLVSPGNPPTVVAVNRTGVEVDIKGMPHDLRIHSEKKSKNLDGSWRYKRGVDDVAIAKVEAEIQQGAIAQPIAQAPVATTPPPPAVTLPPPVTLPPLAQPVAPPQVAAPVVAPVVVEPAFTPPPTPMASVKPAHTLATFKNNLTELLAQFINEGKINQEYIASLCTYFENNRDKKVVPLPIANIWNVLQSERMCMELYDVFVKAGFITEIQG